MNKYSKIMEPIDTLMNITERNLVNLLGRCTEEKVMSSFVSSNEETYHSNKRDHADLPNGSYLNQDKMPFMKKVNPGNRIYIPSATFTRSSQLLNPIIDSESPLQKENYIKSEFEIEEEEILNNEALSSLAWNATPTVHIDNLTPIKNDLQSCSPDTLSEHRISAKADFIDNPIESKLTSASDAPTSVLVQSICQNENRISESADLVMEINNVNPESCTTSEILTQRSLLSLVRKEKKKSDSCTSSLEGNQNRKNCSQHSNAKPSVICKCCSTEFARKSDLDMHFRTEDIKKPFRCCSCSATYAGKGGLLRHLPKHTGEKPYECHACSAAFVSRDKLTVHFRMHSGERPFKCNHCPSAFTSRMGLISHRRTHSGEKPFECDVCSAAFILKSSYTIHLRTHTGEKPFKCETCAATFSHKCNLNTHIRIHTGEKPFVCDRCPASFAQKNSFVVHLRTHTGEKPFECNICQASFAHKGNLKHHAKMHTDEKP